MLKLQVTCYKLQANKVALFGKQGIEKKTRKQRSLPPKVSIDAHACLLSVKNKNPSSTSGTKDAGRSAVPPELYVKIYFDIPLNQDNG